MYDNNKKPILFILPTSAAEALVIVNAVITVEILLINTGTLPSAFEGFD